MQRLKSVQPLLNSFSIFALSAFLFAGCAGGDVQSESTEIMTTNSEPIVWNLAQDDELMAYTKLQMKSYAKSGYIEVTSGLTGSAVSVDKMRVWVSSPQAQNYQNLSLASNFPVGTTVLRVMHDAAGNPKTITATVKAPFGTNPKSADWVFAVADANGVIARDDLGEWRFGALEACNLCHNTRLDTDGLFGLATNNLAPMAAID
jgi:hypothetical protein